MSDLVGNPEDWFSHVASHLSGLKHFIVLHLSGLLHLTVFHLSGLSKYIVGSFEEIEGLMLKGNAVRLESMGENFEMNQCVTRSTVA